MGLAREDHKALTMADRIKADQIKADRIKADLITIPHIKVVTRGHQIKEVFLSYIFALLILY